jgi:hypothetical protein
MNQAPEFDVEISLSGTVKEREEKKAEILHWTCRELRKLGAPEELVHEFIAAKSRVEHYAWNDGWDRGFKAGQDLKENN